MSAAKEEIVKDNEDRATDETDPGADPVEDISIETPSNVHRLPLHTIADAKGNISVKRARGRPKTVSRKPDISDLEYHAEMSEEKRKFVDNDPVVIATSKPHHEALPMLRVIASEIAREQAALAFQRIENEKLGKDTAQVSSRRVEALTKIANIELEMKKLGTDIIDFRSEKFAKVFQMWVESIREVAEEVMPAELIDLFFNRLSTKLEGWEDKAADLTR